MAVTQMKIKEELPPNYLDIVKVFPNLEETKPIFCYGDTIYNPWKRNVTPDLEIHEEVHFKQQGTAPDLWWDKYLSDEQFRLNQETEAYGEQYKFAQKLVDEIRGGSKMKKWALESMAKALSGETYGSLLTYHEAEAKIRNYGRK